MDIGHIHTHTYAQMDKNISIQWRATSFFMSLALIIALPSNDVINAN